MKSLRSYLDLRFLVLSAMLLPIAVQAEPLKNMQDIKDNVLTNSDDNPAMHCYLAKGHHLPEGVEFADECYFTDMLDDDILWLVTQKEDMWPNKYGFVNNQGKVVIPIQYSRANAFMEGKANVEINDKWGYIDTEGEFVIPAEYALASRFRDGLAAVKNSETHKLGYINHNNDVVIPFEYADGTDFLDGYATVSTEKNNTWGIIDNKGKMIVPFEYEHGINQIKENEIGSKFTAYRDNRTYLFDKLGKPIMPMYDDFGFFAEGLINVKKGDKWGFVDIDNNVKIDFLYDDARGFFQGLANVEKDNKHGFINPKGETVIPIEFDMIKSAFFADEYQTQDIVTARKGDDYYLLYKDGTVKQLEYDYVHEYLNGQNGDLLVVGVKSDIAKNSKNMLYGVINTKGDIVIPIDYIFIYFSVLGLYRDMPTVFTQDEKVYVLDEQGNIIADQTEEYKMMMNY